MFVRGNIVFCKENQQVYVFLGECNGKAQLRNLLNLEVSSSSIRTDRLLHFPTHWPNYDYYVKLSKSFL